MDFYLFMAFVATIGLMNIIIPEKMTAISRPNWMKDLPFTGKLFYKSPTRVRVLGGTLVAISVSATIARLVS